MAEKNVRPDHYIKEGEPDVIDMIKVWNLNFNVGNVLKYIVRHKKKGDMIGDLKKAREYLDREIKYLTDK